MTPAATATKPATVRLRSRYARFRVRDTQFERNVAVVTPSVAESLKSAASFGRDFWVEPVAQIDAAASEIEPAENGPGTPDTNEPGDGGQSGGDGGPTGGGSADPDNPSSPDGPGGQDGDGGGDPGEPTGNGRGGKSVNPASAKAARKK